MVCRYQFPFWYQNCFTGNIFHRITCISCNQGRREQITSTCFCTHAQTRTESCSHMTWSCLLVNFLDYRDASVVVLCHTFVAPTPHVFFTAVMVVADNVVGIFVRPVCPETSVCAIACPCYPFPDGLLQNGLPAVNPADASKKVDECGCRVENVISQFSCFVVVWKHVMVVVKPFPVCQYWHT